jgi:acyl-coenzyme A synthetase/AMP-(fatty) acid ligase
MQSARHHPGHVALIFRQPDTDQIGMRKYCTFLRRVLSISSRLNALPDGPIAILAGHHPTALEALLAAMQSGRQFVLIDSDASHTFAGESQRLQNHRPQALIIPSLEDHADASIDRAKMFAADANIPMWSVGPHPLAECDILGDGPLADNENRFAADTWTAPLGTLYPKDLAENDIGYGYTPSALHASACGIAQWLNLAPGMQLLSTKSLARCDGLTLALAAMSSGATLVLDGAIRGENFWSRIAQTGADMARIDSGLVEAILDRPITPDKVCSSRLGRVIVDTSRLPMRSILKFLETYDVPVIRSYGTDATGGCILGVPLNLSRREYEIALRDNVSGSELPYCNVHIEAEPDIAGRVRPNASDGFLAVRGHVLSCGWFDGTTLHPWTHPWLRTQALANRVEIQQQTYYNIQGRADDAVSLGTHRVWPIDVEYSLMETFDFLQDCVVVGRREPNGGTTLCAAVVLNEHSDDLRRSELLALLMARIRAGGVEGLPAPSRPHMVVALPNESIPRDAQGRPDRTAFTQMISQNQLPGTMTAS